MREYYTLEGVSYNDLVYLVYKLGDYGIDYNGIQLLAYDSNCLTKVRLCCDTNKSTSNVYSFDQWDFDDLTEEGIYTEECVDMKRFLQIVDRTDKFIKGVYYDYKTRV